MGEVRKGGYCQQLHTHQAKAPAACLTLTCLRWGWRADTEHTGGLVLSTIILSPDILRLVSNYPPSSVAFRYALARWSRGGGDEQTRFGKKFHLVPQIKAAKQPQDLEAAIPVVRDKRRTLQFTLHWMQ